MYAQSPSKRFTRGIPLHVENSVERPSFSLGLTQDFGEVSEENAKRKEVVVSGLLEHDEAVKFLGKREPTRIPHMQCYTNIEVMKVLATKLTSSQEIEGSSKDAILIHVNGTTLQFTIRDFAIISGLKCSDNEKDFYFGVEKAITKSQLVEKFDNKVWGDNDDDAVKYIDYPWGKKAFDLLILHLHTKIKHDGKYFRLYGFPLALQVWFYECCSNFDEEIVVKVSHHIPRILNWKTKKFPRLSYFAKGMFRDDNNPIHFPTETTAANASDDDFQDPPCPINNKEKKKLILNKTTPRVISKQPCLIKSPRRANVAKRPKSPLPKRQAKKHANVPSYTGIKQNVEIKSSVAFEIPSTSKSHDFSISRDEFDQFKLLMEKQFTDLRNFIENSFKVVLDSIKSKNAKDKGDSVEVTEGCSSTVPSSTPEVSIHQSNLHSPAGQSTFSPLVQQFSNPEPQGHNNSGVPINFKVQNTSNIFEVQNNSEKENCEDVPIEVVKEGSQFMDDQIDFNNFLLYVLDLLNVTHDQTEKMKKEEFTDTNKAGSSNVNELVVEEVLMCPTPLQMHTPLPIHRERRLGPFNTSPYVTLFGSESGSSSRFHFSFDLKHPFIAMSDLERTTLNDKEERYKKNKSVLQMWFHFGIVTVQNKNWFYSLAYKNQLLDDSESTEESIIEYINGYRMHAARPWHTVDNILIPVNAKEIFHWILIVVSINDRSIQIYDSLRGGALHDSSSDFYGKKGIDISSHPKYKSHSECDSFEMIYVNDIPQQDAGSLECGLYVATYADHISNGNGVPNSFDSEFTRIQYASLLWNYGVQKIQADATSDNKAPERPIKIHRDCDSSEKITIN
ncbi:hypothetical protein H5410_028766 [Solanum commersonii]|uniref:Ubiquitin-like protease family profile domain-containing protein n=1 Tax=Solanum commersonii TaxID=4109 RepID=A0A9J5Z3L3_SOLCO|nr:hypothetical protein H5410_028766 [Solanum commersonii]